MQSIPSATPQWHYRKPLKLHGKCCKSQPLHPKPVKETASTLRLRQPQHFVHSTSCSKLRTCVCLFVYLSVLGALVVVGVVNCRTCSGSACWLRSTTIAGCGNRHMSKFIALSLLSSPAHSRQFAATSNQLKVRSQPRCKLVESAKFWSVSCVIYDFHAVAKRPSLPFSLSLYRSLCTCYCAVSD